MSISLFAISIFSFITFLSNHLSIKLPAMNSRTLTVLDPKVLSLNHRGDNLVAIVTGANKGIGLEIVKRLAAVGYQVIIAARNIPLGIQARDSILAMGYSNVEFRQLDVSSSESVKKFVQSFDSDYPKCDILVNNAAIAFKSSDPTPFHEQAEPTFQTNYFGLVELTTLLLPKLRQSSNPHIVNVASEMGQLRILNGNRKELFTSEKLSLEQLNDLVHEFILDVKNKQHIQKNWPNTCYGMSKLALIAYTKILSRQENDVITNACSPGYCATDMSSHKGPRSAAQGSLTPFLLSILPNTESTPRGLFYSDEKLVDW